MERSASLPWGAVSAFQVRDDAADRAGAWHRNRPALYGSFDRVRQVVPGSRGAAVAEVLVEVADPARVGHGPVAPEDRGLGGDGGVAVGDECVARVAEGG